MGGAIQIAYSCRVSNQRDLARQDKEEHSFTKLKERRAKEHGPGGRKRSRKLELAS